MSRTNKIEIPEGTVALRPVRIDEKNNQFLNYEAFTFADPPSAIWQILMQCGGITTEDSDYMIDFLDKEGCIAGEVKVVHKTFYAIVRRLKAKRDRSVEQEFAEYLAAKKGLVE